MTHQKIHLIAIGGAAMHNIALDLKAQGHTVTGSDDEIYEPSLSRLKKVGICPQEFGWFPEKITSDLDAIILGMHARAENPELQKALALGVKVYSYPEFIYQQSINKKRVVIAGSHGKTTTTAMVLHVLKKANIDFDFLVGAQLNGFDRMVRLSNAPLIVIEGDEYLSSAIDRVPKILHYQPHIAVITGIAWDHINVFPTFDSYKEQFQKFASAMTQSDVLIAYANDPNLSDILKNTSAHIIPYTGLSLSDDHQVVFNDQKYPIDVIGFHNLENMHAAMLVCKELGVEASDFLNHIADFSGANKRLQKLSETKDRVVYLDFAHAPSKVKATTDAFKAWFGNKKLLAVLELHTFSSLNQAFLPEYLDSLQAADEAIVYFNEHTLQMKDMPALDIAVLADCFGHPNLRVMTDQATLSAYIRQEKYRLYNILLMTSGNFNQMTLEF